MVRVSFAVAMIRILLLPIFSYGGGVSRCCYDDDGNLLYTADSSEGSTSYKASPYGSLPYNEVHLLPYKPYKYLP